MSDKILKIVETLSLEEKAKLCGGADFWNTVGAAEKGIPVIMMTDGPHGLRKQGGEADNLGINQSVPATCFPSAAAMANSWDTDLIEEVGRALGDECLAQGVSVLLGPGANIKRSPLCGRNFEYFSEDPFLSSHMAAAYIEGVQSKGVGCAIKHFAANNQEENRMAINAQVDERALREIYLASFEYAVKKAKPWLVMSAYNRLNGDFCSENARLLNNILRDEWGFDGAVVSDWGAVDDRVAALKSGLDLEMPGPSNAARIVKAVESGELDEDVLNQAVSRIAALALKAAENKQDEYKADYAANHLLAKRAAAESMVLLKNRSGVLPLRREGNLAVIGEFARKMRFQGAGSSRVNAAETDNVFEELANVAGAAVGITYAQGYSFENDDINGALVADALEAARDCENIVVIAGIPDKIESEGFDRADMRLPKNQNHLIEQLAALGKKMAVVLVGGAPVELPWLDKVDCLLAVYLGGQAVAGALAQVLYGDVCPSGKLAETWPEALEHNPSFLNFPGDGKTVQYNEGIFVGYRYYEAKKIKPMFPFGYGLSYTQFKYSNLRMDKDTLSENETLTATLAVKNEGHCAGKEIIQFYVAAPKTGTIRPVKELKGFIKVSLNPDEAKTVSVTLTSRDFAWYDSGAADWRLGAGEHRILVGASSTDIRLETTVQIAPQISPAKVYTEWSTFAEIMSDPAGAAILARSFADAAPQGDTHDEGLGVDVFELAKNVPLKKMIAMSGRGDTETAMGELLRALNGKNETRL
jgi:beta-glucosidase